MSKDKLEKTQKDLENEIFNALKEPFNLKAYSIDSSRGFDLASLKAQYIPDRLNQVLGLTNWQFSGFFEPIIEKEKETGVLYHGILTIKIGELTKNIPSVGYSKAKSNVGDSRKGAMTDALSKAASHVGVADEAFKGLISCDDIRAANAKPKIVNKNATTGKAPSFKKNKDDLGF